MTDTIVREIGVSTDDGICRVHLQAPAGGGRHPGVILYIDAPGIRPAVHEIAARLAAANYAVAMPDIFWRVGRYAPIDPKLVFTDPTLREAHRARFNAVATPAKMMKDARAILAAIHDWPEVASGPVGVVGYCMGGKLALLAAGNFPAEIAAAASYHAGGLATDDAGSPHRLASAIHAKVYVAGAMDDPNFPDAMKARLEAALAEAGVDHVVETYPARHGWVPRDMPAHDPVEAEHHWRTLLPFLDGALRAR